MTTEEQQKIIKAVTEVCREARIAYIEGPGWIDSSFFDTELGKKINEVVAQAHAEWVKEQTQKRDFVLKELKQLLSYSEDNLSGWSEDGGYLLPTEPDPEEREAVRRGEKGAIQAYQEAIKLIMTILSLPALREESTSTSSTSGGEKEEK